MILIKQLSLEIIIENYFYNLFLKKTVFYSINTLIVDLNTLIWKIKKIEMIVNKPWFWNNNLITQHGTFQLYFYNWNKYMINDCNGKLIFCITK